MQINSGNTQKHFHAIWISDVHLGHPSSQAAYLQHFLEQTSSEHLYLVGDIVDIWALKKHFYWPDHHNRILETILDKARQGTKVIYIPGNHDDKFKSYYKNIFANIYISREWIHETRQGKKLLVLHGDQFDSHMRCSKFASHLGSIAYEMLLYFNRKIHQGRQYLNLEYWSLANYLKNRVGNVRKHVQHFEAIALTEAARQGMDGIVCGHIHQARLFEQEGLLYCNTGDWVENCTALTEDDQGHLALLHWATRQVSLHEHPANNRHLPKAA